MIDEKKLKEFLEVLKKNHDKLRAGLEEHVHNQDGDTEFVENIIPGWDFNLEVDAIFSKGNE